MNNERGYPCQLAVLEKAKDRKIEPFESLVGLPNPQCNIETYRISLDCPISDRHCCYCYVQGTEKKIVKDIAIDNLCGSCEYKIKIEEEENERSKYKR